MKEAKGLIYNALRRGVSEQTPTLIFASRLSIDDESSLLHWFPFPYQRQCHGFEAWLNFQLAVSFLGLNLIHH